MIQEKTFDTLNQLNQFVEDHKVKVISISDVKQTKFWDLPVVRGMKSYYEADVIKLYYEEC